MYGIEKQKQNDKRSIYLQKKNLVDELVAKRKNVQVALTVINNSLKYIFSQKIGLESNIKMRLMFF